MNRICLILFLLLFFIYTNLFAQKISFNISHSPKKTILFQLEGEKESKIDSIITTDGKIHFSLKNKFNGFYRLKFDNSHFITFIYDGEDVEIKADFNNLIVSLKIIKSESNKLYNRFIKLNKAYKTKTELLNLILSNYPKDDDYYSATKNKLLDIQNKYLLFINITSQVNPNSFITRYIKSAQLPIIDLSFSPIQKLLFLKNHSLDNVDFNDDVMINSDLFTSKSIEYLTYYRNPKLPKELLEKEFMKAVDTLLNKAKINEFVYQHITEYLIDGFRKFGFDTLINYIVDNYVIKDNICLNVEVESSIQKRIDQSRFIKIGVKAPNIIMNDISGNIINLNKINTDNILILFYASWCPHCKEIVPKISRLYNNQRVKKIEVLAVSIDNNKKVWLNFIKEKKLNWINVNDNKGWIGKAALDYYLYATPTMIVLDKNKKIVAKPSTIEEVSNWF